MPPPPPPLERERERENHLQSNPSEEEVEDKAHGHHDGRRDHEPHGAGDLVRR
jgi:hypothetical protein